MPTAMTTPAAMKRLLAILTFALTFALASSACHARCTGDDLWTGDDKNLHFAAGVAIGGFVTKLTSDPWTGFYTSTAVGVAKELYDAASEGECSLQDLAVTAAGSALGAYLGNVIITRSQGKTIASYAARF